MIRLSSLNPHFRSSASPLRVVPIRYSVLPRSSAQKFMRANTIFVTSPLLRFSSCHAW